MSQRQRCKGKYEASKAIPTTFLHLWIFVEGACSLLPDMLHVLVFISACILMSLTSSQPEQLARQPPIHSISLSAFPPGSGRPAAWLTTRPMAGR